MKKKILCVCQGGNVRSVALATLLKQVYRQDALACGIEKNQPETVRLLCSWANVIVVMEPQFAEALPTGTATLKVCDVGRDRFGRPNHPELQALVKAFCETWKAEGML